MKRAWLIGVGVAVTLVAACVTNGASRGEAKSRLWVITGGELGSGALLILPEDGELVLPPAGETPLRSEARPIGPHYELYPSVGVLDVALQAGRPAYLYYPEPRLLVRPASDAGLQRGFAVPGETAAKLDEAIAQGLSAKASGDLQRGVVRASLRVLFRSNVAFAFVSPTPSSAGASLTIELPRTASWDFAMDALAPSLERPARIGFHVPPAYVVQVRTWHLGDGVRSPLAYYTPPARDQPGKLWRDAPGSEWSWWFPTTAEFDATFAGAARAAGVPVLQPLAPVAAPGPDQSDVAPPRHAARSRPEPVILFIGGLAILAVLSVLVARSVARQRRS